MIARFLCSLLLAGFAMAQQFHIDHVTVAGRNVAAMQKTLEEAGLASEYGGPHSNHATEMALTSFPDGSYLELIGIQPNADPAALQAHYWRNFLEHDGGPCAWAIRPANFAGEVDRLRAAGVMVSGPHQSGRKRPDDVQLEWETAQAGPTNGGFFPFLIHDFTPRENRAFPGGKPTVSRWSGVAKVVIAVKDLDAAILRYKTAFGLAEPARQEDPEFGAKLAWFRGTPLILAAPLSNESWLRARLEQLGEAPCAFILAAKGGLIFNGRKPSQWFGTPIAWANVEQLGWHLGFEPR